MNSCRPFTIDFRPPTTPGGFDTQLPSDASVQMPCGCERMCAARRATYSSICCSSFIEKGSVESTHKVPVPTSHYHAKHCHAVVASLGGLTHRRGFSRIRGPPARPRDGGRPPADSSRDRPPMPPRKKNQRHYEFIHTDQHAQTKLKSVKGNTSHTSQSLHSHARDMAHATR